MCTAGSVARMIGVGHATNWTFHWDARPPRQQPHCFVHQVLPLAGCLDRHRSTSVAFHRCVALHSPPRMTSSAAKAMAPLGACRSADDYERLGCVGQGTYGVVCALLRASRAEEMEGNRLDLQRDARRSRARAVERPHRRAQDGPHGGGGEWHAAQLPSRDRTIAKASPRKCRRAARHCCRRPPR